MRQAFSFSTDCPYTPRNRRNKWFIPKEFRLFRGTINTRNTGEHKMKQTLGILFQNILRKRKQLRISFSGTKIKANFREFCSEAFCGRKQALNSVFWNFCFESLPSNAASENFKNSVWKDDFWGTDKFRLIPFRSVLRNWLFRGPRNASGWALSSPE